MARTETDSMIETGDLGMGDGSVSASVQNIRRGWWGGGGGGRGVRLTSRVGLFVNS